MCFICRYTSSTRRVRIMVQFPNIVNLPKGREFGKFERTNCWCFTIDFFKVKPSWPKPPGSESSPQIFRNGHQFWFSWYISGNWPNWRFAVVGTRPQNQGEPLVQLQTLAFIWSSLFYLIFLRQTCTNRFFCCSIYTSIYSYNKSGPTNVIRVKNVWTQSAAA